MGRFRTSVLAALAAIGACTAGCPELEFIKILGCMNATDPQAGYSKYTGFENGNTGEWSSTATQLASTPWSAGSDN